MGFIVGVEGTWGSAFLRVFIYTGGAVVHAHTDIALETHHPPRLPAHLAHPGPYPLTGSHGLSSLLRQAPPG